MFTTALCLIKLLSSCYVSLVTEPKYGSCNEIYLGEGSGASSLEKGVCCRRATFHITFQHKTTLSLRLENEEFCDVAKVLRRKNFADIQHSGNIFSKKPLR